MIDTKQIPKVKLTADNLYLAPMGRLWGVYCGNLIAYQRHWTLSFRASYTSRPSDIDTLMHFLCAAFPMHHSEIQNRFALSADYMWQYNSIPALCRLALCINCMWLYNSYEVYLHRNRTSGHNAETTMCFWWISKISIKVCPCEKVVIHFL